MASTQVLRARYVYRLHVEEENGGRVYQLAIDPTDFTRALEADFFDALRRGVYTRYDPPLAGGWIEPRFAEPDSGLPWLAGFFAVVPAPGGSACRREFAASYFRNHAIRFMTQQLRSQGITANTRILYQLAAYQETEHEESVQGTGLQVEPASVAVPLQAGSLSALGQAEPWDDPRPEDLPVLIPRRVLEEAVEEARRAPEREVAGVLLGHLRRDVQTGEVFKEITALVPAEETEATTTSVTFTAATWARVRKVVEIRGEEEIFAGWVHSHPFRLCSECPLPVPAECVSKVLFYSSDDVFLMEQTFPRPFMVGLLTAVEPKLERALGHLPVRLYGWRDGEVCPRGFHVIDKD
jgi:proteasome lid subunit RPN8/RPN11